jgi:hypothetical protein
MGQGQGAQGGFGGGQSGDPEERRRRIEERLASMTPDERAQFQARMKERGIDPSNMSGGMGGGRGEGRGAQGAGGAMGSGSPGVGRRTGGAAAAPNRAGAQTIDQLFGPLPTTESSGRVWLDSNGQLKMVRLRLGITDGTYTELLSGELAVGQELVTSVITPAQAAAASTRSPLMPGGGRPGQGPMPSGGQRGGPGGH